MVIYPLNSPIILTDTIFVNNGGAFGTFTTTQRNASYQLAEMQVTSYIGTPLLPVIVTGTYPFMNRYRLATDYGYVQRLLSVNILTQKSCISCDLQDNAGCGYIYEDTYGYIDFNRLIGTCHCGWFDVSKPYQIQLVYEAGLPTGTANQPGILEALTILAQIDLNEKIPGLVGMNESAGDIGVQKFKSLEYFEERKKGSLINTALGDSAKSMRAKRLLDMSIRRARKVLMA